MLPRIDSCSLTIRYPAIDRELDEALAPEAIPPYHRWISADATWEDLLRLHGLVAPARPMQRPMTPAELIAELVEYGLMPAAEVARREFPGELSDFCERVWHEAFDSAPANQMRLICLDFAGPLWACAGTVVMASRLAMLVALRLAGRYKAVATREPQVPMGADLQIDWSGPVFREFRPGE